MSQVASIGASSREMHAQFDLLARDAKEYSISFVGPEGHLLCWNVGAERTFGYRFDEVVGRHFSRFFAREDIVAGRPEQELKSAITDGHANHKCWQVRKDGTRFWCHAHVTPLFDERKQVRSFARVLRDLTQSDLAAAERKRAEGLTQANRSKDDFMALLSHELRSPLTPILNSLFILRQIKTNDPIVEQAVNIIGRQVGQVVRLVDDVLDVSRITKGKLRLTKEHAEVRVIVNHAAETARPFIDARKQDFSISLPADPIWVDADPARLEQVVVNLLNNAAKYTGTGGHIRMDVNREGLHAVIRVRDNGVGIAPERLPHIFKLFEQVDGSLAQSHGGLGIGLALARNLVEMHGGCLEAASGGLGHGCLFTIRLPALANPREQKTQTPPELQPRRQSRRILVIDDDVDAANSLSVLLRLYGHEVSMAHTGPAALELASASPPDLVLLDIGLPGMDGYQVATLLRQRPELENVVICAITGHSPSNKDRQHQQDTGFDHYHIKPMDLTKLLDLIKTVRPLQEA